MARTIFGCGYLGRRVADRWHSQGEMLHTVTRSHTQAESFRDAGWSPIVADITQPQTLSDLPTTRTVLFAVGFDRNSGCAIEDVYVTGLKNVLDALDTTAIERFIYISSTGVYGQNDGAWVDENSACEPTRDGGKACLAAEQLLLESPLRDKSVILRLAGIYGPDRIPRKRDLEKQEPMPVSNGFLNLIHVDDAADIVVLAERYSSSSLPATFVVADGCPVKRCEYYDELARLLKINPPTYCDPESSDQPVKARRLGSKRVSAERMLRELKPSLNYSSYREGLASILGVVDAKSGES